MLLAIGAVLGQPRWGFIVVGGVPFFIILLARFIAKWYCEVIKRQHFEVRALINGEKFEQPATGVQPSQNAETTTSRQHSTEEEMGGEMDGEIPMDL